MSGREEEFRDFALTRAMPLHRSAYLLCGDWHIAHDLVQETLARAYSHWHRVSHADSPDAYVRQILLNEARKRWRRRENAMPVARVVTESATADAADEIVRRAGLLQALLALPAGQRETVVLRYLEGMTERETAALLGCSEGTVKSQTSRALTSLRTFLERTESRR